VITAMMGGKRSLFSGTSTGYHTDGLQGNAPQVGGVEAINAI